MKNIYSTLFILVAFNSIIMGFIMYVNYGLKKSSISWCELNKETCKFSYKIIHNIDTNSSFMPTFENIKPCLLDYDSYHKKVDKVLDERKEEISKKN